MAFELGKTLTASLGPMLSLGTDPRSSGPALRAAFLSSALESGAEVTDYGLMPTPALAYQTSHSGSDGGVVITASHNPKEYNGFKIFNSRGEALDDSATLAPSSSLKKSNERPTAGDVRSGEPHEYVRMLSKIQLERKWRVVLDPGNGATGGVAASVYEDAVGKATFINSHPDGNYSGRGPEPTRDSVSLLRTVVSESHADIGIAFDGDGDRFYVVDEKGDCPLQDRILASYISFLSQQSKGPFLVPVDASMVVDDAVSSHGAKLMRGPVGDAKLLAEMKREGLSFAGEPSGAWIHGEFHPCPDGLLSGLLYLRELERSGLTVSRSLAEIPEYRMIRKSISVPNSVGGLNVTRLSRELEELVGKDSHTDSRFGIRVSSEESWVLVRESGTEPVLRVTVESKSPAEADRILKEALLLINRTVNGPA